MLIFINPGHDIKYDSGAVNTELPLREADVALDVGNLVSEYLEEAGYATIVYQDDSLESVCDYANAEGADLFVSIHCNSAESEYAHGTECFVFRFGGESEKLANSIQNQLLDTLHTADRGVKECNFYVCKCTDMPATLVELAFISNYDEACMLRDNQDEMARAIARGVTDYLSENW